MPKLTLQLDALQVETFDPSPTAGTRAGTVHAHSDEAEPGTGEVVLIPETDYKTCRSCPICTLRITCDPCVEVAVDGGHIGVV